jgi:hypothetical protein
MCTARSVATGKHSARCYGPTVHCSVLCIMRRSAHRRHAHVPLTHLTAPPIIRRARARVYSRHT